MQAANNMMFISPETASPSREAGHLSAGKANGQPPAPGTWLAVLENTSSAPGESPVWKNPSAALQSALEAPALDTDGTRVTDDLEKSEQRSAIHVEHEKPLSAPDQAIPETSEAKTVVALDETSISLFATPGASPAGPPARLDDPVLPEAAPTATSADPSQESNNGTPRVVLPTPVDASMANTGAGKDGTVAQARAEGQAGKQPSADLAGSIAALPREHHLAGKSQLKPNRSPETPSVEGLPEKSPDAQENRLPGRLAPNRPQPAALAGSPENGRQALNAGHSNQQQVVAAMPSAGQVASQPSMAAASASATIAPTLDDGATLRLELPLWSTVGITEMPVNENQGIRPHPDLPPASREMRMLSDVIEKAYWHQENGRAQARIQIKPAFLGHLHLNVLTDQARVSVEIRVETPMAREFIEMNLQTLKTDLQESGLEIDRIDVTVDRDADDSREPFREPARKQNRRSDTSPEMVETAPLDKEAPQPETDNGENSINTFA